MQGGGGGGWGDGGGGAVFLEPNKGYIELKQKILNDDNKLSNLTEVVKIDKKLKHAHINQLEDPEMGVY